MAGAITQDPIGIGYKAVEAAVKAANGETIEKILTPDLNITTRPIWIRKI